MATSDVLKLLLASCNSFLSILIGVCSPGRHLLPQMLVSAHLLTFSNISFLRLDWRKPWKPSETPGNPSETPSISARKPPTASTCSGPRRPPIGPPVLPSVAWLVSRRVGLLIVTDSSLCHSMAPKIAPGKSNRNRILSDSDSFILVVRFGGGHFRGRRRGS